MQNVSKQGLYANICLLSDTKGIYYTLLFLAVTQQYILRQYTENFLFRI